MNQERESQVIIVNRNPGDASIQIVIPPFRPINLYELEDDFESVTAEIRRNIYDETISSRIVEFITAFKESMEEGDILPIIEYFIVNDVDSMNPEELQMIFDAVKEFVDTMNDESRLMH